MPVLLHIILRSGIALYTGIQRKANVCVTKELMASYLGNSSQMTLAADHHLTYSQVSHFDQPV